MQGNFKYPRIKKIHQILEKITRFDQKVKILCVLLSHELLSTKTHYISIYIFYIFISRQVQKSKNYENPTSMPKVTYKTIFIVLFKLFSICHSFELKVTQIYRSSTTDLVMCQYESHENVKEYFMTSPHVMPHPIIS